VSQCGKQEYKLFQTFYQHREFNKKKGGKILLPEIVWIIKRCFKNGDGV